MASPSLYARYLKEREQFECIERPEGFLTYQVQGDACYIRDVYVRPDHRKTGVAAEMADQAAQAAMQSGCSRMLGTIDLRTKGHEASLRTLLAYGFELAQAHEGYLILQKLLGTSTSETR